MTKRQQAFCLLVLVWMKMGPVCAQEEPTSVPGPRLGTIPEQTSPTVPVVDDTEPGKAQPATLTPRSGEGGLPQTASTAPAPPPPTPRNGPYTITGFRFRYGPPGREPHPGLPPAAELIQTRVSLRFEPGVGYTGAAGNGSGAAVALVRLKRPAAFTAEALQAVCLAVSKDLNDRGIYGVFVTPDESDLAAANFDGAGLSRQRVAATPPLTLIVYASEIDHVSIRAKRVPKKVLGFDLFRINPSPADSAPYEPIAVASPLRAAQTGRRGSLLENDRLQDYLTRLNRFPGRHVDVAVTAADQPAAVNLEYTVTEEVPPVFLYDQVSNTGTRTSGELRNRLGLEIRQLLRHDDLLDASYDTSFTSETFSVFGSYQWAVVAPDYLKAKLYGGYGRFTADDVGFDTANFTGDSTSAGALLIYTPCYFPVPGLGRLPLDLSAGFEWRRVSVENNVGAFPGASDARGETSFALPVFGVSTDKAAETYSVSANFQLQPNIASLAGTSESELAKMGRFNVSRNFLISRYGAAGSVFLEPLLHPTRWEERKDWRIATLAHELSLSIHGQYTFDRQRLVPQFEDVVGGFATVRGYPESYVSGDSSVVLNAEYRFHLTRVLKPIHLSGDPKPSTTAPTPRFSFRPREILGSPDLDVVLRGFLDFGYAHSNDALASIEADRTLLSVGAGAEMQLYRNFDLRVDWGFPLRPVTERVAQPVTVGSSRINFVGTVTF